ncbi:hypothetical protein GMES_0187 [Paraglaciecola mesophila KMM 241]|uniref:Transposase n=1 Tax=Paraglaciecola mesophila KMM 241 TaxID=1128912 RepID=K6YWE7_9ALTE|nr:hypothetical protein GMES_0187 [Paraglaciecola mesophila KMM 241]
MTTLQKQFSWVVTCQSKVIGKAHNISQGHFIEYLQHHENQWRECFFTRFSI